MNCIKCGREIDSGEIFCGICLEEMEQHPVKPGTVVLLPPKQVEYAPKKPARKRQSITPEEQIRRLKRRSRILIAMLILTLAAAGFLGYVARSAIGQLDIQKFWGQNYSSVTESPEDQTKPPLP